MTDVCPACGVIFWSTQGHVCGRGTSRVRMVVATVAGWLRIDVQGDHANRCRCPFCNQAERAAREEMGMPVRHPERVTDCLSARQEDYLEVLATRLWPGDEYLAILANPWQD
jgi:hypothetical protein